MLHLSILRWGQPYESLEKDEVVHFSTGEPIATVSRANGGLIQRDARKAKHARGVGRRMVPIELTSQGMQQRFRLRLVPDHLGEKAPLRMQWYRGVYEKYQD